MAICSRRVLQRLINENAGFLKRRQVRAYVDRLNQNDAVWSKGQAPSLATEWEIILLNAFSKIGIVEYERDLGGSRHPDLHFVSRNDATQCFTADITAVSDRGFEGLNSFDALLDDLLARVAERGLRQHSFSLQVKGNFEELYRGGPKARLKLPARARFKDKIFDEQFSRFLDISQFLRDHNDVSFVLTFSVEQRSKRVLVQRCATDSSFQQRKELFECIGKLVDVFPEVESDPVNALNYLTSANPGHGRSYWGGLKMGIGSGTRTSVRISARALTELLAGKVSQKEFFERHGFVPSEDTLHPINPFEVGLRARQVIANIAMQKTESKDDDWIEFTLRGPDPAISSFVMPEKQ